MSIFFPLGSVVRLHFVQFLHNRSDDWINI